MKTGILSLPSSVLAGQKTLAHVVWIAGFSALVAVGAQIEIPNQPVPYTLQTFFVLLSGALLGKRYGPVSQILYLLLGVAGLPVYSGWGFGIARLLGPTGGYLLSFPVASFVVGYLLEHHKDLLWSLVTMAIGLFVIFSLGTIQLNFVYFHNWRETAKAGALIFSWWDAAKLVCAALLYHQIIGRKSALRDSRGQ